MPTLKQIRRRVMRDLGLRPDNGGGGVQAVPAVPSLIRVADPDLLAKARDILNAAYNLPDDGSDDH